MKKLAIILGILLFAPCVFAMDAPNYDVDSVTNTSDTLFTEQTFNEKIQTTTTEKEGLNIKPQQTTTYERKINAGSQKSGDTNSYWNHGGVKFGTGGAFNNGSSLNHW